MERAVDVSGSSSNTRKTFGDSGYCATDDDQSHSKSSKNRLGFSLKGLRVRGKNSLSKERELNRGHKENPSDLLDITKTKSLDLGKNSFDLSKFIGRSSNAGSKSNLGTGKIEPLGFDNLKKTVSEHKNKTKAKLALKEVLKENIYVNSSSCQDRLKTPPYDSVKKAFFVDEGARTTLELPHVSEPYHQEGRLEKMKSQSRVSFSMDLALDETERNTEYNRQLKPKLPTKQRIYRPQLGCSERGLHELHLQRGERGDRSQENEDRLFQKPPMSNATAVKKHTLRSMDYLNDRDHDQDHIKNQKHLDEIINMNKSKSFNGFLEMENNNQESPEDKFYSSGPVPKYRPTEMTKSKSVSGSSSLWQNEDFASVNTLHSKVHPYLKNWGGFVESRLKTCVTCFFLIFLICEHLIVIHEIFRKFFLKIFF